jgi:hypothetical protein
MHACLLQIHDHALPFYLFYHDLSLIIGHGYVLQHCLNKDRFFIMLTLYIQLRPMFELLTDSLFVAICHSNWLYSRKYGTVWYHPASSRFYLTVFILSQFQGKLTGTLLDSNAWATCVVWTSLGPLSRWVPGPTTRWAPGTTRLALHGTWWRGAQGLLRRSTRLGSCTCPALYGGLLDVLD